MKSLFIFPLLFIAFPLTPPRLAKPQTVPFLPESAAQFLPPKYIREIIQRAAAEFGIPQDIAISLAWNESEFCPKAIGQNATSVDYGLFQLNSNNAELFCQVYNNGAPFDPLEPEVNTRVAMAHLKTLWKIYGTWRRALYAWNCGRIVNVPAETVAFVDRILGVEKA